MVRETFYVQSTYRVVLKGQMHKETHKATIA